VRVTQLEDVQTHYIANLVVERECEKVEIDDRMQSLGKVVEQCGQIALLRDGFADFEQGFQLPPGMIDWRGERQLRRESDGVRHS